MADELEPIKVPGVPADRAWSNFEVRAFFNNGTAGLAIHCHLCADWSWRPPAGAPRDAVQVWVLADVVEDHRVTRHGGLPRG